jgi:hypothetical protein
LDVPFVDEEKNFTGFLVPTVITGQENMFFLAPCG